MDPTARRPFAGFWIRTLAYFLDLCVAFFPLFFVLLWFTPARVLIEDRKSEQAKALAPYVKYGLALVVAVYFSWCEASPWQASLGKRWLRLKVVDQNGERMSPRLAIHRNLLKFLSGAAAGIGFFALLFRPTRQAWHDSSTDTYVVARDLEPAELRAWVTALERSGAGPRAQS